MYPRPGGYIPTEPSAYLRYPPASTTFAPQSHIQNRTAPIYPPPPLQNALHGRFPVPTSIPTYAPPTCRGSYRDTKLARQQRFRQDLDEQIRLKTERKLREQRSLEEASVVERQRNNRKLHGARATETFVPRLPFPTETGLDNHSTSQPLPQESNQFDLQTQTQGEQLSSRLQARFNLPPSVPGMDKLPMLHDPRQAPHEFTTPRGTTYSRFQVDRAPPEVRNEREDRHRKQQEVERMLRLQLEEKNRRKADEKRQEAEEEENERRRLEREREELRIAYEREKKGIHNREGKSSQAPVEWATSQDVMVTEDTEPVEPKPSIPDGNVNVFNDNDTAAVDARELQAFRDEVLAQHDSLKQQVDSQERILAQLQREVEAVKHEQEAKHAKEQSRKELELVLTSKSKFVRPSEAPPGVILQQGGLLSPSSPQRSQAGYKPREVGQLGKNSKSDSVFWDEDNTDQLDELLKDFVSRGR